MQILWYDYETSGRDAAADRPVQLGWQATDPGMEPVADAESLLVRLPDDVLPSPGAMLVHRILPDVHQRDGISEAELANHLEQLIAPRTLVAGYNSRGFDDKFTQHIFYRCLRDPYAWQYADGRGRFDLYPVVLTYFVLAPEAIRWPEDHDGRPRFKLDRIGPLNRLDQGLKRAHDASSDVAVTARLARQLALHDPDLFATCLKRIDKHFVTDQIRADGRNEGLLEVTSFAGWDQGFVRDLWIPFRLSERSNYYVAFDLNYDPQDVMTNLIGLVESNSADRSELRKQVRELGVYTIRINAQPMLFSRAELEPHVKTRLEAFGRDEVRQNKHLDVWHHIRESPAFKQLYQLAVQAFVETEQALPDDVDFGLYAGNFLSTHDKDLLASLPLMDPKALSQWTQSFDDLRYDTLLFRYRARNFPQSLTHSEWKLWQKTRREKLMGIHSTKTQASRVQDELVAISQRTDLDRHQIEYLEQFVMWLDKQPPV
ncbi:MAG: exodeoxyribonuclease I [Pseudomonadota bacterium]|nr:exodeoxyribonuclease I [Pseudomonadota bacterium]